MIMIIITIIIILLLLSSELIVNRILTVSIVVNKILKKITIFIIIIIIIIITYLTRVNLSVKDVITGENDTNFSTEEYRQLQQIKIKISRYRCILVLGHQ